MSIEYVGEVPYHGDSATEWGYHEAMNGREVAALVTILLTVKVELEESGYVALPEAIDRTLTNWKVTDV